MRHHYHGRLPGRIPGLRLIIARRLALAALCAGALVGACAMLVGPRVLRLSQAGEASGAAGMEASLAGAALSFTLIVVAGAALVVSHMVSHMRRLRKLTDLMRAVESGELDRRAESLGDDELGAIAQSVNNLLDTIAALTEDARGSDQRERQNALRSVFESSPLMMGIVEVRDDDLIVVSANSIAARVYGRTADELTGQSLGALGMPAQILSQWLEHCQQAYDTMRSVRFEYSQESNGQTLWFNATVAPIDMEEGEAPRVSFIVDDVTELKGNEQRLRELSAAAVESARLKTEFLANMSHEIRTPMNGIMGMTELLLETPLADDQRDYATTAHDSAQALLTILNDILDFSKIEAGKLDLEQIDFEPRVVVESVADLLSPKAAEKRLALMTYVAPAAARAVRGDPSRLRQILLNLVGNAVKFTTAGDVVVEATLDEPSARDGRVALRFAVRDTGIGLSEHARSRLFQPFTQADGSTTRKYGGTGLGLSICRRLVDLMGGAIGVESEEGRGSTFWFTIPFEAAQTVPAAAARPSQLLRQVNGRRALVVDDNRAHRAILLNYFSSWGLVGAEAEDAQAGIAALREAASQGAPFDAVVVDYTMPGMDGMAAARAILADPSISGTRLILLTAFDEIGLGQQALRAGFSAYLTKPVKQLALLDALARALDALPSKAASAAPTPPRQEPAALAEQPKRQRRILLAEDNAVNQKLALLQLERLGYSADVAGNGRQALTMLSQRRYALVLMDVHMPEMDGYEATMAIRASEAPTGTHLPIIAMTANALQGDQERCLAAGMDAYLSKPVTLNELRAMLQQWMPADEDGAADDEPAILRGYGARERRDESPRPAESGAERPATDTTASGSPHVIAEETPAEPLRVLLVDDNNVNLKLTTLQLRRLGCAVDVAVNGRDALQMLTRGQYALVLMDCNMPVMDGYEATRAIRSSEATTGSHLPVIAVTANALTGDREICLEAGMDDYVAKPVKLHALKALIEQWAPYGRAQEAGHPVALEAPAAPTTPTDTAATPATILPIAGQAARPAVKTDQAAPLAIPRSEAAPAGSPVDLEQLEAIRALQDPLGPNAVAMVIEEFGVESGRLIWAMRRAQADGDAKELHRTAHSLKSSAAYLGAGALADLCAELETLAKTGMTPGAATARLITRIDDEFARVVTALGSSPVAPDDTPSPIAHVS